MYCDLEFVLDFQDSANISLNDFLFFLKDRYDYDMDIGEPINDPNAAIEKKESQENPITYNLTSEDYFRGVKTILNSEIAAICYAEKIFNECEKKN